MIAPKVTGDQERWAEALMVHRQHGDRADVYIAERIASLVAAGDEAGVERWREIAARVWQLVDGGTLQ